MDSDSDLDEFSKAEGDKRVSYYLPSTFYLE